MVTQYLRDIRSSIGMMGRDQADPSGIVVLLATEVSTQKTFAIFLRSVPRIPVGPVARCLAGWEPSADMQEKTLRRYLLGLARPEEQVEIEHWLIDQHDSYDLINAAEDDLINDSLAENLKADDLERFNSHFLITEERRRKVQFARSLRRLRGSVGNRVPDPKPRSCGG
jgi:hypothetical protein